MLLNIFGPNYLILKKHKIYLTVDSKSLENSKSAFVCCSDELRGWVCNNSPKSKNCVSTSQYSSSDLTMGSNVYIFNKRVDLNKRVGWPFNQVHMPFPPYPFMVWKFAGREDFFLENNKRVYPFIRDLRVVARLQPNSAYIVFMAYIFHTCTVMETCIHSAS